MAALNTVSSKLGQVPIGNFRDEVVFDALMTIHIAILNLIAQLNSGEPVMMSPNGHYWTAAISNTGTVTWTDVGTVRP